MYPRINIDLEKLKYNAEMLYKKLDFLDELYIVTKAYSAYLPIVEALHSWGYRNFADSRIINLKSIKEALPESNTLMLRLPLPSEVDEVVKYCDRSLNSEIFTIKLLNEAALKQDKVHEIILMVDLGDLREGVMFDQDYYTIVDEILKLKNIKLLGVGTNLTCYGAIIPTRSKMEQLVEVKENIEKHFNIKLPIVSGGNSSTLPLALENNLPKQVNNLRIGEGFIDGHESAYGHMIDDMVDHIFTLEAEVIEVKDKPSYPIGKRGFNAFGEEVEFEDVGIHRRVILAIGRQDVSTDVIEPMIDTVKILGSSSDHMLLETTDKNIKVGDKISFYMEYGAILSCFTSKYVAKNIIK
ncbi:alanine/ornithine racemase family PLP-dependent enzyme [Mycoplasma sp. P36-A1]|uniref:alanine/ornithine racemase family PLP-dependent enzyme n=1 Tax=Mycoplasma sp. P36-A1 TaxID=3252900 RepID=UPI003C2E2684